MSTQDTQSLDIIIREINSENEGLVIKIKVDKSRIKSIQSQNSTRRRLADAVPNPEGKLLDKINKDFKSILDAFYKLTLEPMKTALESVGLNPYKFEYTEANSLAKVRSNDPDNTRVWLAIKPDKFSESAE